MLARFEWRLRHSRRIHRNGHPLRVRTIFIGLLSCLFVAWLVYHHLGHPAWLEQLPPLFIELLNLLEAATIITAVLVFLFLLWRSERRKRLAARSITVESLYALSPGAFERYVADLFRKKGYTVTVRGRSGDHGVDLELRSSSNRLAVVQCKRYRNTIGPDIVRELFGTMIHEGVHHAFLVTTADISPAARQWARNKPMTLIAGPTLVQIARTLNSVQAG